MRIPGALAAILLIIWSRPLSASIIAGPFTYPANGHSYFLLSSNTWTGAEAEAISLGGHLTTINDLAENDWVYQTFANYGGIFRGLWIGVSPVVIAEMRNPALVSDHDSSNDALLIVPGVSVGKVRAGMTVQQVVAELGQPDRKTGRRLHYVRQGFSVLPRDDSDVVLAIFCGDNLGIGGPMSKAFKGRTREGIGMGSDRADII